MIKRSRALLLILALTLVTVLATVATVAWFACYPNRNAVVNQGSSQLRDVEIGLYSLDSKVRYTKRVPTLNPGESFSLWHDLNDSRAKLTYVFDGAPLQHEESYIDLWRGETWFFTIDTKGDVHGDYKSGAKTASSK